jgi:hypothetical protein
VGGRHVEAVLWYIGVSVGWQLADGESLLELLLAGKTPQATLYAALAREIQNLAPER